MKTLTIIAATIATFGIGFADKANNDSRSLVEEKESVSIHQSTVKYWQESLTANEIRFMKDRLLDESELKDSSWLVLQRTINDALSLIDIDQVRSSASMNSWQELERLLRVSAMLGDFETLDFLASKHRVNQSSFLAIDLANHAINTKDHRLYRFAMDKATPLAMKVIPDSANMNHPHYRMFAGKLEWLRTQEHVEISELEKAIEQLQKATKKFHSVFGEAAFRLDEHLKGSRGNMAGESMAFAALESWIPVEHFPAGLAEVDGILEPLAEAADEVSWGKVTLPDFRYDSVTRWLLRQLYCQREGVAIAYLAQAKGEAYDRARLLAMVATELYENHSDDMQARHRADVCLEIADSLVGSQSEKDIHAMEACCHLAIAHHASGDTELANELVQKAMRAWAKIQSEPADELGVNANLFFIESHTLLLALAKTEQRLEDLPKIVADEVNSQVMIWGNTPGFDVKSLSLYMRGSMELADMSLLAKNPSNWEHPEFEEFYKNLNLDKWHSASETLLELIDKYDWLHKTSHGRQRIGMLADVLAGESVKAIGLKETLKWTATINDEVLRMKIELAAVLNDLDFKQKLLPIHDINSPKTVGPIQMLWKGC